MTLSVADLIGLIGRVGQAFEGFKIDNDILLCERATCWGSTLTAGVVLLFPMRENQGHTGSNS